MIEWQKRHPDTAEEKSPQSVSTFPSSDVKNAEAA
jgi:hypothetical protein